MTQRAQSRRAQLSKENPLEPQDAIASFISALLMYIMYPALMIGMLLWLVFAIRNLIVSDYLGSPMRRIAAAVLPFTMLMFFIVLTQEQPVSAVWARVDNWVPMLCFGACIGLVLMVSTTYFAQRDEELAPVMHSFILSLILCFILYCIMNSQEVNNLQYFFLGMIMASCFYIMFRGTDDLGVMKGPRYTPPPPPPPPRFRQTYAPPPGGPSAIAPAQIPHPGPYGDPTMPPPEANVV